MLKRFAFSQQHNLVAIFVMAIILTACAGVTGQNLAANNRQINLAGINQVTAAFGPDGRLWRVLSGDWQVYVDFSDDLGATFSRPVTVNTEPQRMRGNNEDRARIAVNHSGFVFVVYPADARQPWTAFFSASSNGLQFSKPVALSDQAEISKHGLANLSINPTGEAFLVWHDNRQQTNPSEAGLYWTLGQVNGNTGNSRKAGDYQCECCQIALDHEPDGTAVLFTRQVYPGQIRDHGFWRQTSGGDWQSWRATDDGWEIQACPEHGPAFIVSGNGRYHLAWFTQGSKRSGLFYANSDNHGGHLSEPKHFGNLERLPGHPLLAIAGQNVAIAWWEYDGRQSYQMVALSPDNGTTWSPPKTLAVANGKADAAQLLSFKERIYLSWFTQNDGYRLIPVL